MSQTKLLVYGIVLIEPCLHQKFAPKSKHVGGKLTNESRAFSS